MQPPGRLWTRHQHAAQMRADRRDQHSRQGSWPGMVGGCTLRAGHEAPGAECRSTQDPPTPLLRGRQRKIEIPCPPAAFGPQALRTKPRGGKFCFCSHLQLMGGHLSSTTCSTIWTETVLGLNMSSCGEMTRDTKRLLRVHSAAFAL